MSCEQTRENQSPTQRLEAATQITSRLFAHVSHDLGNPLFALRGYIKMVLDGRAGPLTDVQREYLTVALENANRLCGLANRVNKIPDFIDRLNAEVLDIHAEWKDTVHERSSALLEKAIKITERSLADRLAVAGDRKQLRQVFERVIDVSIESAQHGDEIVAEFARGGDRDIAIRISVSSNGIPSTTDLSLAQNIVFFHGGTLSFETRSTGVSAFLINFPEAA